MSWIADNPDEFAGSVVDNGQCVRYVQICAGVPHTSRWQPGAPVRGNGIEPGTAIATFDRDGSYGNHTDGRSHAAIFIAEVADGLLVWDQWTGHPVAQRVIRFRGGSGRRVNDGDQFQIIEGSEA
jgi:hypothetical protein